jgi:hypothetical protein
MNKENEIVLSKIENDFGTGFFVSWADGETKNVMLANWGIYKKETDQGPKIAFRASVLILDGKEYCLGEKVIDTTSINFHKTIKPFILKAEKENKLTLQLEISRKGDKRNTVFFMKEIEMVKKK